MASLITSPASPAAKRVIYLFMSGGPPQMDMWDYKPGLAAQNGKDVPQSILGKEFGRTVYSQGGNGRDHHAKCHTMWMAGGGVKGGIEHGRTDDYSYRVEENPVEMRDLNATILHTLGMDKDKLSFRHGGLDEKLVGVLPTKVVKEVLA